MKTIVSRSSARLRKQLRPLGLVLVATSVACSPAKPADAPPEALLTDHEAPKPKVTASPAKAPAVAALEKGDFAVAESGLTKALADTPNDPEVHYYLGVVAEQKKDVGAAVGHYKEALAKDGTLAAAAGNLGAIYLDQGKNAEAKAVLAPLAKGGDPALLSNLALAEAALGETAAAKGHFSLAAKASPKDPPLLLSYANFLASQKDPEAAGVLRQTAGLVPDDVGMLTTVGVLQKSIGAFDDCIGSLDAALAKKKLAEIFVYRGLCRLGAAQKDGAKDDFTAAIALDKGFAPAHFYLGGRFAEAGKKKEAKAEYDEYVKLAPNGPLAAQARERSLVLSGKVPAKPSKEPGKDAGKSGALPANGPKGTGTKTASAGSENCSSDPSATTCR